jgi:hypothetical protein
MSRLMRRCRRRRGLLESCSYRAECGDLCFPTHSAEDAEWMGHVVLRLGIAGELPEA